MLGPKPSLDGATFQRLEDAYRRRTDAPPSQFASLHFKMPFDSASLGDVTDPSRLPVWDRRPRVMVDARTAPMRSSEDLADDLVHGERTEEGKRRAARTRQGRDSKEEESDEGSSAAESSSAEEDESL